ncbi:hypothetical protein RB601_008620 [Gaeumannomyces tritici]
MDSIATHSTLRATSNHNLGPVSTVSVASPPHSSSHQGHSSQRDKINKTSISETSAFLGDGDDGGHSQQVFDPVSCRSTTSAGFWGDLSLDILQILLVIPFIVLGIIVLVENGKTTTEVGWLPHIITAATYGPTIFPLLFASVVGRFMKAAEYWKLERRSTIETIEQLHGSRTVISAFITQFQLQSFNLLGFGIVLIWALSPVGSQAALRVGAIVPVVNNIGLDLSYLDVRSTYNPNDSDYSKLLAGTLFTTSILMPARAQSEDAWDVWGNARIPMVESLDGSTSDMGWISTEGRNVSYASLIGIPMLVNSTLEAAEGVNVSFSFDTSYWWLNCSTQQVTNTSWAFPDSLPNSTFGDGTTRMAWTSNFRVIGSNPEVLPLNDTEAAKVWGGFPWEPRRVHLLANNTRGIGTRFAASCNLTTTFVNVNSTCSGAGTARSLQRCRATAVRQTHLNATRSSISILDMIGVGRPDMFFENFLSASETPTGPGRRAPALSPQVGYLANPRAPFAFHTDWADWREVSARDFSIRFTHMLNTYWISAIGYKPVQGDFTRRMERPSAPGGLGGNGIFVETNQGAAGIPRQAFKADVIWTAVLLLASAVLLSAAAATLVLNLGRKYPDGLENFSSLLCNTPYARIVSDGQRWPATISSMLTGFERARLLKNVEVQVGDVAPTAPYGYVALCTPATINMERLKKERQYL